MPKIPKVERHFVTTRRASLHIAAAGEGEPVLLLHQTPRSWDEFREVLPLLGSRYRAIAMDTVGFGDSSALPADENSIESWAECAIDLLDALHIERAAIVGHHTGAAIAMEMAAASSHRVSALILSSPPLVDAARRARTAGKPAAIDAFTPAPDGSHLTDLWSQRQPHYPEGAAALLDRYLIDALKAGPLAAEGHRVVNRYVMEPRLKRITCPTLVIGAEHDHHASPAEIAAAIPGARQIEIPGGMIPLPDQKPTAFAEAILAFLDTLQEIPR
ncbi:alpha/beta fold hydrolase [Sphingomonas sp. SRS2]|uniref:alpha/beta fold hydrolase n=1 Tax=Sphingomonas sp. SRS2 TaxID=133190 RepID=UPI00061844D0|nr:alpha/beta hydrolase [Sphingomonas sp. SRS2]KKC27663.1 alpha/beta hydrolase [Sphingomonas sp. SRS2]